jgi:hypothetical protein
MCNGCMGSFFSNFTARSLVCANHFREGKEGDEFMETSRHSGVLWRLG